MSASGRGVSKYRGPETWAEEAERCGGEVSRPQVIQVLLDHAEDSAFHSKSAGK
jgi:hypothetical protein